MARRIDESKDIPCGQLTQAVAGGTEQAVLEGHTGWVQALCPVTVEGKTLLASAAGGDETVRLWNPASALCTLVIPVRHRAFAIAAMTTSLIIGLDAGVLCIHWHSPTTACPTLRQLFEEVATLLHISG